MISQYNITPLIPSHATKLNHTTFKMSCNLIWTENGLEFKEFASHSSLLITVEQKTDRQAIFDGICNWYDTWFILERKDMCVCAITKKGQ